jgi:hypothetical protein
MKPKCIRLNAFSVRVSECLSLTLRVFQMCLTGEYKVNNKCTNVCKLQALLAKIVSAASANKAFVGKPKKL